MINWIKGNVALAAITIVAALVGLYLIPVEAADGVDQSSMRQYVTGGALMRLPLFLVAIISWMLGIVLYKKMKVLFSKKGEHREITLPQSIFLGSVLISVAVIAASIFG